MEPLKSHCNCALNFTRQAGLSQSKVTLFLSIAGVFDDRARYDQQSARSATLDEGVSTITAKVAVLNDLYTRPDFRGNGAGRQLIEHCRDYAAANACARLQWVSSPDNKRAQVLYDALDTSKSTWFFYTYNT